MSQNQVNVVAFGSIIIGNNLPFKTARDTNPAPEAVEAEVQSEVVEEVAPETNVEVEEGAATEVEGQLVEEEVAEDDCQPCGIKSMLLNVVRHASNVLFLAFILWLFFDRSKQDE